MMELQGCKNTSKTSNGLFSEINYNLIGEVSLDIIDLLNSGGAECSCYLSDATTHCITGENSVDTDIDEAANLYLLPVVSVDWVVQSVRCDKLLPINPFVIHRKLFSGLKFCVTNLGKNDCARLWGLITFFGGEFSNSLNSGCSHLISCIAKGCKYDFAVKNGVKSIKIVTPDWIIDSVKSNSILAEEEYHPKYLICPSQSISVLTGFVEAKSFHVSHSVVEKDILDDLKQRMPWNYKSNSDSVMEFIENQATSTYRKQSHKGIGPSEGSCPNVITNLNNDMNNTGGHNKLILFPQNSSNNSDSLNELKNEPHNSSEIIISSEHNYSSRNLKFNCQFHGADSIQNCETCDPLTNSKHLSRPCVSVTGLSYGSASASCSGENKTYSGSSGATDLLTNRRCIVRIDAKTRAKMLNMSTEEKETFLLQIKNEQLSHPKLQKPVSHSPCKNILEFSSNVNPITGSNFSGKKPVEGTFLEKSFSGKDNCLGSSESSGNSHEKSSKQQIQHSNVSRKFMISSKLEGQLDRIKCGGNFVPATPRKVFSSTLERLPSSGFVAYETDVEVPEDLFLVGCVFLILEYDRIKYKTASWENIIEGYGGHCAKEYSARVTHIICQTQTHSFVKKGWMEGKRCITAAWLNEVISRKSLIPPWTCLHFPTRFSGKKPCTNLVISFSGFNSYSERVRVKRMIETTGAKVTPYFSAQNNVLICKKLEGEKYKKAVEWGVSVFNVQWLNEMILWDPPCLESSKSNPKYTTFVESNSLIIDYTLVEHLMHPWLEGIKISQGDIERAKSCLAESPQYKKRRVERKAVKKVELASASRTLPVILFSGSERSTPGYERIVMKLGGTIAKGCKDCTHLVMLSSKLTSRLLCSLSTVQYIVSEKWLLDSFNKGHFMPEYNYIFSERVFEKKHNCNVSKILSNPNRSKLFAGLVFYVTPGVKPFVHSVTEMIISAGGIVQKDIMEFEKNIVKNCEKNIIITCLSDIHLVSKLLKYNVKFYDIEFITSAILNQKMNFDQTEIRNKLERVDL